MTVRVRSFAKLNLFLHVLGLRSDGFHDICSQVQTIDLADVLEISPAADVRVLCRDVPEGENIVTRAVRVLLREKRSRAGARIVIRKHIPIGAGLGGGSSDAASVMATVNQLVLPTLSPACLADLATEIGSDVALFLRGGCMELTGRGEPGAALPVRSETFVLLVPPLHCSTRDVYQVWHVDDAQSKQGAFGRNDLFLAAARIYPELAKYKAAIDALGGLYSGMTGSGSAFFAAFSGRQTALRARDELARQERGCRVYCCEPTASGFIQEGGVE